MSLRLTAPPGLGICSVRPPDAGRLGSDLGKEGTQGAARHFSAQRPSSGGSSDGPGLLGQRGLWAGTGSSGRMRPLPGLQSQRVSELGAQAGVSDCAASIPRAPRPSYHQGAPSLGPLREQPAPSLAGAFRPSLLPPCGHRRENSAAAPRPWPPRATAAATLRTVGSRVARGCAALGRDRKRP